MRLLYCNGDGGFSLAEFFKSAVPKYAILSHTWGEEEVTLADLQDGTGTTKAGYEKIRFCAQQATRDSLRYFWIDTCCIDKSNSAELAKAINSMFRWYRMSTKCYVYLSDVSRTAVNTDVLAWESAFRKSRWFTRGWTLQELIAPTSVEFFSREAKRIGSKSSLEQQIHEITGISISALQGARLSQFDDKDRFSWVEHRQTKVEEDKAYSLLGIFDVQMPVRYGEGMANAFQRLEKEIDKFNKCLQDLHLSNPRDDKKRIEDTKGGLLKDSYRWILENSDFHQWSNDQQSRLLWIKGDPGKGKTMLLCGIINELEKSISKTHVLSYFFCQATDLRINHATAVLRGLLYHLLNQEPSLVSHIQKKHDHAGKALFEGANAWTAMSEILRSILQDPKLNDTYLIIDALDECVVDLPKLLDFIAQTSSVSTRVKWVVSSRNWPEIEKILDTAVQKQRLCLELNAESVSNAVATFIQTRIHYLSEKNRYTSETRDDIHQHLSLNAHGTFLWVALVCQELSNLSGWKAVQKLKALPPGLDALYQGMLNQIIASEDSELCMSVLAVVSTVYRPITIDELVSLVQMPNGVDGDYEALAEIIGYCRSFLAIRERTIFFVHQSAKDFLIGKAPQEPLLLRAQDVHNTIFSRSLQVMSITLRRDIYNLSAPGISIEQVKQPDPDPLAAFDRSPDLRAFIQDATRFAISTRSVIEQAPLQAYCSALVFAPEKSIIREMFETCVPHWILRKPRVEAHWSATLQTLEGHSSGVSSVAFSPDGKQAVSGSYDATVRLWDAATGALQQTLEGHS
ncbi:NACHT domain-containing protein, partial [Leptodontidium sp. 2 PMI_412]